MSSQYPMSVAAKECYKTAVSQAKSQGKITGTSHYVSALLSYNNSRVAPFIKKLNADPDKLAKDIAKVHHTEPAIGSLPNGQDMTTPLYHAIVASKDIIGKLDYNQATVETMLAAISLGKDSTSDVLRNHGVTEPKIVAGLKELAASTSSQSGSDNAGLPSALLDYGDDLTAMAREGKIDPVIGRDSETRRVMQILSRRTKNNPVVVGPPGSGKTAIIEGLARRIVQGDCPEQLKGKTIYSLDLAALSAGAKYQGEYEERVKAIIKAIKEAQGSIITFIDEIHMMASGDSSPMNLSNMLKPMLARGEMHLIGATTLSEYRQFIEVDPALDRRFQQVVVQEPSVEDTIGILRGIKEKYENHHGVKIQDSALVACAELSDRYISAKFLPDKAIDLMDESSSRLTMLIESKPEEIDVLEKKIRNLEIERMALSNEDDTDGTSQIRLSEVYEELTECQEQLASSKSRWDNQREGLEKMRRLRKKLSDLNDLSEKAEREGDYGKVSELRYNEIPKVKERIKDEEKSAKERGIDTRLLSEEVTADIVAEVVSSVTGIPASKMSESETQRVLTMEEELGKHVIGQPEAISELSKAVKKSRAGVSNPNRPVGSFLFAGPSGTGKTELSKVLANHLYGDPKTLIVFSMEEYGDKSAINKLVGSPAGYVGYGDTPALEEVRHRPSSIVLFDELEKAHDQVIITLLSIMEEGRITLNNGTEVDFTNTIIIFTSNLGAETGTREGVTEAIKARLRPEFINRLDAIIPFNSLSMENLEKVVDIQINNLESNMAAKRLTFSITPEAKHRVAELGYDPAYGARPVRRVVSGIISDILADKIILGEIQPGDRVIIDVDGGKNLTLYTDGNQPSQSDGDGSTGSNGEESAVIEASEMSIDSGVSEKSSDEDDDFSFENFSVNPEELSPVENEKTAAPSRQSAKKASSDDGLDDLFDSLGL